MEQLYEKGSTMFNKYKNVEHVEMEMRLGKIYRGGFDTDVGHTNFSRILTALEKFDTWENIEESDTSMYYSKNVRTSFNNVTDEHLETVEKTKIDCFDTKFENFPYDVRFCASVEKPIESGDTVAEMVRVKRRKSYTRKNLRIDMTVVKGESDDMDDEADERYEVELEIMNVNAIFSDVQMYNTLYKVVCVMNCCCQVD